MHVPHINISYKNIFGHGEVAGRSWDYAMSKIYSYMKFFIWRWPLQPAAFASLEGSPVQWPQREPVGDSFMIADELRPTVEISIACGGCMLVAQVVENKRML